MKTTRDRRRRGHHLAGIVSAVVLTTAGVIVGLPGLVPCSRADDTDAPSRREARPTRPRMDALPPAAERPPRRPFDDADEGDLPRGAADNRAAERVRPASSPRRLGATVAPVPDAVREQIDLAEGVGLLLDSVEPGGPAATAGLKRFDILTRFNDQIVCNADQFATLVKLRKPGAVPMTVLRGGKERKLQVILPQADPADEHAPMAEAPGLPPGFPPGAGQLPGDLQKQMEDLARQLPKQPFGAGAGRSRTTRMSVSPQGNERIDTESDGTTTIELRQSAGKFSVEIRGADGAEIHSGKLDTDADRRRVPEEYRARVERLIEEVTGFRP